MGICSQQDIQSIRIVTKIKKNCFFLAHDNAIIRTVCGKHSHMINRKS